MCSRSVAPAAGNIRINYRREQLFNLPCLNHLGIVQVFRYQLMSKTVRRVSLASIMLLLFALGSCEIGQRKWQKEVQELEKGMEASGFYISHVYPDTNG